MSSQPLYLTIHSESKISYKKLTDADLKRSPKSHQTHIGLSDNSLTFMQDDKTEYSAMLIHNTFCDIVPCEVGRIKRADGSRNAPNIKSKGDGDNSVVKKIRDFAKQHPKDNYYLVWFGLDSCTPLFWLIGEKTTDYNILDKFCHFEQSNGITTVDNTDPRFNAILQYAKERLEYVALNLQKDLEVAAETEVDNPKFKDIDIKKARKYIQEIGRSGEELVNEYLEKEKINKNVIDFEWTNKSSEKGKPYDFFIHYGSGLKQWMDVKATEHEFGQAVIVSKNEINFITEKENREYSIFRVYSKEDTQAKLKICSHCLKYMSKMQRDINYITQSMSDYKAYIANYKIAFEPGSHCFNQISDEILLSKLS